MNNQELLWDIAFLANNNVDIQETTVPRACFAPSLEEAAGPSSNEPNLDPLSEIFRSVSRVDFLPTPPLVDATAPTAAPMGDFWQAAVAQSEEGTRGKQLKRKQEGECSRKTLTNLKHVTAEKKRRDKIKERIKTLQQLLPSCDKKDSASILEEAVVYIKSLQSQYQMLCAGYTMSQPQYILPGMWTNLGLNFGMGMYSLPFPTTARPPLSSVPVGTSFLIPQFGLPYSFLPVPTSAPIFRPVVHTRTSDPMTGPAIGR